MDLFKAAGNDPATRWCLTIHGQDGAAAVAHGCAPGLAARLGVQLTPIAAGACQHTHAEPGYTPGRRPRHLVQARNTRCVAPGCARPAAACDPDHTLPWQNGG